MEADQAKVGGPAEAPDDQIQRLKRKEGTSRTEAESQAP